VNARSDNAAGGLLSRLEIRRRCNEEDLMTDWEREMLRPAGYNVRIAKDGLVTPKGEIYKPLTLGGEHTYEGILWLSPGDEAELSSFEKFKLPDDVAGNITIRTEFSAQGLLLLSGLLIDPGYGPADNGGEPISDGRLHFFVANVGAKAIPLRPGTDSIAAVQFFHVVGGEDPDAEESKAPTVARWDEPRPTSRLGFIANLKDLQEEHAKLGVQVERTRELTVNLLVLGYFLLAATILGLTLDNLLSVGSDETLVKQVSRAVPDSVSGKVLMAAAFITAAWVVRSVVVFLISGRTPPVPAGDRFFYLQARQELMVQRRRWRAGILLAAGLLAFAVIWLTVHVDFDGEEWLWAILAAILGASALGADYWFVKPIDAHAVRERTEELTDLNEERAEKLDRRIRRLDTRSARLDRRAGTLDKRARHREERAKKRDQRAEKRDDPAEQAENVSGD
jgi:deoxycytidine triphosphate deaminase